MMALEQNGNGDTGEGCGVLITRETDYALRVLRALSEGEQLTAGDISEQQMVPKPFAYKIIKKLSKAGFFTGLAERIKSSYTGILTGLE